MDATKRKKYLRRALGAMAILIVLAVPLLFAALQTPPARHVLARQVSQAVSTLLSGTVQVDGLTGTVPTHMRVARIQLEDEKGIWLELEDVRVRLSATSLLRGQVLLPELSASKVNVLRAPNSPKAEGEPFAMPTLPELPSWLKVESIAIERLFLAEGLVTQAATLHIEGSLDPSNPTPIQAEFIGLDETQLSATLAAGWRDGVLSVSLEAEDNTLSPQLLSSDGPLDLSLAISGPMDDARWTASATLKGEALADLEGVLGLLSPMAIRLNGTVTPPDGRYPESLREQVGSPLAIQADVMMDDGDGLRITEASIATDLLRASATGQLQLDTRQADIEVLLNYADISRLLGKGASTTALPLEVRTLAKGGIEEIALALEATLSGEAWMTANATLQLANGTAARGSLRALPIAGLLPLELDALLGPGADLQFDVAVQDEALHIATAELQLESAELSAKGLLAWNGGAADLALSGETRDLEAFSGLAGVAMGGSAQLEGSVNGDGTTTQVRLTADGNDLFFGEARAPSVHIELAVDGGALDAAFAGALEVQLTANAPGLALQPDLARDFEAEADVTLVKLQQLNVRRFIVDDGNLHAEASGRVDLATRLADFKASLRADNLAAYAQPLGYPYGGRVSIELGLASKEAGGVLQATATGRADQISGLPADAARLLGQMAEFTARAAFDGALLHIETITLKAGQLDVVGNGRYRLENRAVEGALNGSVGEVASLAAVAGQDLSGGFKGAVAASGTLDALSLSGALEPQDFQAGALQLDSGRLSFDVTGIPSAISGDVSMELRSGGENLAGKAAFSQKDSSMEIGLFEIKTGANSLRGQGLWNTSKQQGSGSFDAELPDLSQLQAWLDLPLEGAVLINGVLSEGDDLESTFCIANLRVPGLLIGEAQGNAALQNLFSAPSGRVNLFASELKADTLALSRLDLKANGPASGMAFEVQSEGLYQEVLPFTISAQGVGSTAAPWQVNLNTFAAMLDATEVALESPLSIEAKDNGYELGAARVRVADGLLTMQGAFTPTRIEADAEWSDIPLSLGELAGMPPYEGQTSGKLDLSGTQENPIAMATIAVAGLRMPGEDGEVAALDARIESQLSEGGLAATFDAMITDALEGNGTLRLPASWSLSPWQMEVAPDALLDGSFKAQGDLAAIPAILGVEDHVLRGDMNADLLIHGTPEAPSLTGTVTITKGYYENYVTGTILDALTARIEADGKQFRLTEFYAGDSVGGTLAASGELSLDVEQNFPFAVKAELDNMRLIHRDDVSGQVGGPLSLAGDVSGAKVEGQLRIGPAYIAIPERMPEQQITTVDFRVAGENDSEEIAPVAPAPAAYPIALDVGCAIPRGVFVRGPGLESEWAGDIKVGGTAQAPTLRGILRVRQGKLAFLGRDFDLGESTVAFNGASPPAPALNILAVAQQQDITARVRLEGELESLNITLSSDPPLPQDEVLSQVLFGRNLSEVTPFQALQLARYAPLFRSRVSGSGLLGSGGAKPGGLDRLGLQTGSDISDMSVTAGKSLGDDLYLELEQGTGTRGTAVSLEWLFAPNWSLRGKTSTNSEGSAGLFWKKNY